MNREEMVIEYLKKKDIWLSMPSIKIKYGRRGITVREAVEVLGTTELRKIMCRIREKGYEVFSIWEEGENKWGTPVRYKRYYVKKRGEQTKCVNS